MTSYFLRCLILLISLTGAGFFLFQSSHSMPPRPTERHLSHEEKLAFKQDRKAFFEQMHKAAPDVDWKAMEQEIRWQKAQARFEKVRAQAAYRTLDDFPQDTLANGQVAGHWRETGSKNQSGRIRVADYDPTTDLLYCASSGGNIWKSVSSGKNWEVLNDLYQIPSITSLRLLPHDNGQRIFVVSSAWGRPGCLYSDDDGQTWSISSGLSSILPWGFVREAVVIPDSLQTIYVLAYEQDTSPANWGLITTLYRSTDQGTSFTQIETFHENDFGPINRFDIWADRYQEGPLYLLENQRIHMFDALGTLQVVDSFNLVTSNGNAFLQGLTLGNQTTVYALYEDAGESHVYRSDSLGTWAFKGTVGTGLFGVGSFACSATNPNHIYVGGINTYRSVNGGSSWTLVNEWYEYYGDEENKLHADIPGIHSFRDSLGNEYTFISTDGGIYLSEDHLATVSNRSLTGLNVSQYYSSYTQQMAPYSIYVGSQDQGFQKSWEDEGEITNFTQVISGDYGHLGSGDGGQSIWCNYPGFSMYLPPTGQTISRDFDGSGHLWLAPLITDPDNPLQAYLGGGSVDGIGANIVQLTVNNSVMQASELPFDFSEGNNNERISALAIAPTNHDQWYVMTDDGAFFASSTAGQTWTKTVLGGLPDPQYFYGNTILPSPALASRVYLGGSGYSNSPVYVSDDFGQTFSPIDNGLPSCLVYDLACTADESLVFAATSIGPYLYIPVDNLWYPMEALSAPEQTYWSVEYIPNLHIARFGTYGRGIWDYAICDSLSPTPEASFQSFSGGGEYSFLFLNQSSNAFAYEWNFGDSIISEKANPFHTFDSVGIFEVQLIASSFCRADTFTQTFSFGTIPTAQDPEIALTHLSVSPNPNQGQFQLHNAGERIGPLQLQLLDMRGQQMYQELLPAFPSTASHGISLSHLSSGIYLLVIVDLERRTKESFKVMIR